MALGTACFGAMLPQHLRFMFSACIFSWELRIWSRSKIQMSSHQKCVLHLNSETCRGTKLRNLQRDSSTLNFGRWNCSDPPKREHPTFYCRFLQAMTAAGGSTGQLAMALKPTPRRPVIQSMSGQHAGDAWQHLCAATL